MSDCPFKVGDVVRGKSPTLWSGGASYPSTIEYPPARITKITEAGFEYEYLEPYNLGARFGTATGGTCFPNGYEHFELAPNRD